ncbi:MAG: hypothetical protein K0R18_386 [Bacillales bacterium]|jgi:hypothetical protein|nr:hypothetical protein [Bacillales bacterium]
MAKNNGVNGYTGFKLMNLVTGKEEQCPYIKGWNNVDSENKAIREQMELTGQSRSDFIVSGLIKA